MVRKGDERATAGMMARLAVLAACAAALLLPGSAGAATQSFSNGSPIAIPAAGSAEPYPSTIGVAGLPGAVTKVTAGLHGLSHTAPSNIDALLVGPEGHDAVLMSDTGCDADIADVDLTFDDAGPPLPFEGPLVSGMFEPTDYDAFEGECVDFANDENFAPGPAPPYGAALFEFNGTAPNGNWRLYVLDDSEALVDSGSIAEGWTLTITSEIPAGAAPDKCFGRKATIKGTTADDEIVGTSKRDVIVGGFGDDIIKASAKKDIVCGNRGRDTLRGSRGKDVLIGGPGSDLLLGGPARDRLFGGGLPGSKGKLKPGVIDLCPTAHKDRRHGCVLPP